MKSKNTGSRIREGEVSPLGRTSLRPTPLCGALPRNAPPGGPRPPGPPFNGRYIDPLKDLGTRLLLSVEKPGRYTGGEYGRLARREADLQTLIAFPDLYEIGMCNQALRILYNNLNEIPGVSCDRAFAPAPDFEALLRARGIPLYGLDTGIALGDLDLLMFTLGYELGIGGVLTMLDLGGIPLRAAERGGEGRPLVLMGGPCVSNPLPYAPFADAFWIGEAEDGFFDLAGELAALKRGGAGRGELLDRLRSHPSVWAPGKGRARRGVDRDFASRPPRAAVFPVASLKTVHPHGAVEIMRGCPNGCRFCHAGYWYRPMRQKSAPVIRAETAAFVNQGGYREISLSSLSTGDYRRVDALVKALNRDYAGRRVSFQLPSLKISSFSLSLLEKVSETRKSGLTFAVETPVDFWQLGLNKTVSRDQVVEILREARKNGWRGAKFYFMIGLPRGPLPGGEEKREEEEIVAFILDTARRTGMHFNVTVGVFVPKPHTPYQRAAQMGEGEARRKLEAIRSALKSRGHRVGVQDPFVSALEGLFSRGDERAGEIAAEAFSRGCRLDAWSEYFRRDIWTELFTRHGELVGEILGEKPPGAELPWDFIDPGVSPPFLAREFSRSLDGEITSPCIENCKHPCGICGENTKIVENIIHDDILLYDKGEKIKAPVRGTEKIIFSFSKRGTAVFQSHLALMEIFSMAFLRAGIPARFSQGFNPLPRLEIAAPLSLGISSAGEIAALEIEEPVSPGEFIRALEGKLPEGIAVTEARGFCVPPGLKKYSLSALLWGFSYLTPAGTPEPVRAAEEKTYRQSLPADAVPERLSVLARFPGGEDRGRSYFSVYEELYPR